MKRILSLFLVLVLVFALSPVYASAESGGAGSASDYTYSKDFDELLELYEENNYYGYGREEALERMIRTLLETYPELFPYMADSLMKTGDIYSGYYTGDQIDSAFGDTYEGFGIVLTYASFAAPFRYGLKVEQVFAGSPADEAGILEEDLILSVNGCALGDVGFDAALEYLGGVHGKVKLEIGRPDGTFEAVLQRATVQQTHFTVKELSGTAALITIEDFNGDSLYYDFYYAMEELYADGFDSLIFDVRGNGGGSLDAALNMINTLVPEEDKRITTVLYRSGEEYEVSTTGIGFGFEKIAVLTDEHSYSAAEFFAISVRELCGAKILGAKTPGKAIGQNYYSLEGGGVAGFTEIEITSPNGTRYNGLGVVPDVAVKPAAVLTAKLAVKNPLNMFNMAQIVPGAKGTAVSALQERLVNAGILSPAAASGIYDKPTRDALRVFCTLSGLGDGSRITSKVIAELNKYAARTVSYYGDGDACLDAAIKLIGFAG